MFALRQRLAANAGFANYMEYAFRAKHRFDYSPADCARFHAAVEATAAPAVERLMAHRRESLGVATVRPWCSAQLESERPCAPSTTRPVSWEPAKRIFDALDPELGGHCEMAEAGLLDLESRPGKAPGGYCTKLPMARPAVHLHERGRRAG